MKEEIIRVTKTFTFDMAHALYNHDGLCRNIHGHTYHLAVTLIGKAIQEHGHPKNGMIIDFGDLKKTVHEKVTSRFDHALVLNSMAPHPVQNKCMKFCISNTRRLFWCRFSLPARTSFWK